MIYYSENTINNLFTSETFLNDYNEYKNENNEIKEMFNFINSIELNKKYFRLEMNKKRGYKKRNQYKETDTTTLKEITSLLNKLTDKNFLTIRNKIKTKLENKNYLKNMIIDSILDKCIIILLISLYLDLINYLYGDNNNDSIEYSTNKLYEKIINIKFKEESNYLRMCERNKKLDKLIGHFFISNRIRKREQLLIKFNRIKYLINNLSKYDEEEEKYKCVQCLYNIFKSYYGDYILPEGYNQKINDLISKENKKSNSK